MLHGPIPVCQLTGVSWRARFVLPRLFRDCSRIVEQIMHPEKFHAYEMFFNELFMSMWSRLFGR